MRLMERTSVFYRALCVISEPGRDFERDKAVGGAALLVQRVEYFEGTGDVGRRHFPECLLNGPALCQPREIGRINVRACHRLLENGRVRRDTPDAVIDHVSRGARCVWRRGTGCRATGFDQPPYRADADASLVFLLVIIGL